jgi:DnaJ-class molecular chaperone
MQWHPDKCHEPNAQEQFMRVQEAYTILSTKRARYDAGLALEASMAKTSTTIDYRFTDGYRAPLRCGLILCEGIESLGVFNISKIFAWEDIRDRQGRTLVTSWPKDTKVFLEEWV